MPDSTWLQGLQIEDEQRSLLTRSSPIILKIKTAGDLFAGARSHRSIPVLPPTLSFNIVAGFRGTVAVEH
jgi:hypothetical protein